MTTTNFDSVKSMMITEKKFPALREEKRLGNTSKFTAFKESLRLENEVMKRTDYFSLRKEGPLKNYPLASQRCNFMSSEFKILDKLFEGKKEVGH